VPLVVLFIALPAVCFILITGNTPFGAEFQNDIVIAGLILFFAHTLLLPWAVFLAILRAKYSVFVGMSWACVMMVLQQTILLAGIFLNFSILSVVLLILIINALSLISVAYVTLSIIEIKIISQKRTLKKIKTLSLMSLQQWPISVARYSTINLPIFVLLATTSSSMLVWYNSLKTLAGIVTRIIDTIQVVNWPSVTRLFIARDFEGVSSNLDVINSLMVTSVLLGLILNMAVGEVFLEFWLGDVYIEGDMLLHFVLIHTLVNLFWLNHFQVLIATDTVRREGLFWLLQTLVFPIFLYGFSDRPIVEILSMAVLFEAAIFIPLFRYIFRKKVKQAEESAAGDISDFAILFIKISSIVIFHEWMFIVIFLLILEVLTLKDTRLKEFLTRRV
jgi:O-antigen/teichoic acid export membrane protein